MVTLVDAEAFWATYKARARSSAGRTRPPRPPSERTRRVCASGPDRTRRDPSARARDALTRAHACVCAGGWAERGRGGGTGRSRGRWRRAAGADRAAHDRRPYHRAGAPTLSRVVQSAGCPAPGGASARGRPLSCSLIAEPSVADRGGRLRASQQGARQPPAHSRFPPVLNGHVSSVPTPVLIRHAASTLHDCTNVYAVRRETSHGHWQPSQRTR